MVSKNKFNAYQNPEQPENYVEKAALSKRSKVIIRCRKCWINVAIQAGSDPVLPCPACGKPETYIHALLPGKKKKEETD